MRALFLPRASAVIVVAVAALGSVGGAWAQSLTTTYAQNNSQNGNIFDVVALDTITIESFDVNPAASGTYTIEVYYLEGSGDAYVYNHSAWNYIGSAVATGTPDSPMHVNLDIDITMGAGETYSFYVTTDGGTDYLGYTTDLGAVGDVAAQDGYLQILDGYGVQYPNVGAYSPRTWNGTIHYSVVACTDADGDGYDDDACGGTDCDDTDPLISPAATEVACDHVDNDCDGDLHDEEVDDDGDGFDECDDDCDDADDTVYPGAAEVACDGVDND